MASSREKNVLSIADGAAIGPEMNELYQFMKLHPAACCYLPESFEWLILKSGLIDGNAIQKILSHPEEHIDSTDYFSWERFFTALLTEYTRDSYLSYSKAKLNDAYLNEKPKAAILSEIEGIDFSAPR